MANTNFAVFGVAHQDDELLQMGNAIKAHLDAGRPTAIVIFTEGGASGIRTGKLKTKLGYTPTRPALARARFDEFLDSCRAIGVKRENIHCVGEYDGELTVERAKEIWRYYINKYPNGSYKGHSWIDANTDHSSIGKALDELVQEGVTDDARFYFDRRYADKLDFSIPKLGRETSKLLPAAAYDAYKLWKPEIERWSCGYLSVGSYFNDHQAAPGSYRHFPSTDAGWTPQLLAAADAWVNSRGGYKRA